MDFKNLFGLGNKKTDNAADTIHWKRLDRKTLYDTQYLKIFEDKIEFPNGNINESYTMVQFPDVVVIVASDTDNNLITINEYKYGPDRVCRVFPAGHIKQGEEPVVAAQRELLEETGYGNGSFDLVGELREFPTKNLGKAYVVRAVNVARVAEQKLDENERVEVSIVSYERLKQEVIEKKWLDAKALASMALTGILNP